MPFLSIASSFTTIFPQNSRNMNERKKITSVAVASYWRRIIESRKKIVYTDRLNQYSTAPKSKRNQLKLKLGLRSSVHCTTLELSQRPQPRGTLFFLATGTIQTLQSSSSRFCCCCWCCGILNELVRR